MAAILPSIYEQMTISAETTDGSDRILDLKLGVTKFNYYEDLFSPTITAQLLITSTGAVFNKDGGEESAYSGLPIRGGERVSISIKNNTDANKPLEFDTPETYLYVSNVSRIYGDGSKEIISLDLVSREAITNETSRVVKRFPKDAKISQHVKTIIEKNLSLIHI